MVDLLTKAKMIWYTILLELISGFSWSLALSCDPLPQHQSSRHTKRDGYKSLASTSPLASVIRLIKGGLTQNWFQGSAILVRRAVSTAVSIRVASSPLLPDSHQFLPRYKFVD